MEDVYKVNKYRMKKSYFDLISETYNGLIMKYFPENLGITDSFYSRLTF